MEQEGHVGDEGGDQVSKVLSRAGRGWRWFLKLQGSCGALLGLAQLDGPTHHLWVCLGEQRDGGLWLHLPHHPPPSLHQTWFISIPTSFPWGFCPRLQAPPLLFKPPRYPRPWVNTNPKGSPTSYQHLLAQLDEDENAGVHHPLALHRPVLEGQVLAFLIQEEPQLFLGNKGRAQEWVAPTGVEVTRQTHTPCQAVTHLSAVVLQDLAHHRDCHLAQVTWDSLLLREGQSGCCHSTQTHHLLLRSQARPASDPPRNTPPRDTWEYPGASILFCCSLCRHIAA